VAKAEGGTVVAQNDPTGGARLTLRLPTVPGPDDDGGVPPGPPAPPAPAVTPAD